MKHLLEKTSSWEEFRIALREYRNTPRHDGLSPSQWLFGRRQRTEIPALPTAYDRISDDVLAEHEARRREKVASYPESKFDLPQLEVGMVVIMQEPVSKRWKWKGTIVEKRSQRSYLIESNGRRYLRNRRFLRPSVNQEQLQLRKNTSDIRKHQKKKVSFKL